MTDRGYKPEALNERERVNEADADHCYDHHRWLMTESFTANSFNPLRTL